MYVCNIYTHAYHPCINPQPAAPTAPTTMTRPSVHGSMADRTQSSKATKATGREMENLEAVGIRSLWVNTY